MGVAAQLYIAGAILVWLPCLLAVRPRMSAGTSDAVLEATLVALAWPITVPVLSLAWVVRHLRGDSEHADAPRVLAHH